MSVYHVNYIQALLCCLAYLLCKLGFSVYKAHTNDLSKVPGPLLNRVSGWPLKLATIQGRRIHWVHQLHQLYGDTVVLSPEEVSINDPGTAKEIHRIGSGFLKAPWYAKFAVEDGPEENKGVFTMIDPKLHAARRRLLARPFAKSSLMSWEEVIANKSRMTIEGIGRDLSNDGKANILAWFTFMANDVIATLCFGDSFKSIEAGKKTRFISDLETVMKISGIAGEFPLFRPLLLWLSPQKRLVAAGSAAIQRAKELDKQGLSHHSNIFANMMSEEGQTLSTYQVEREASNMIVAGSDTTAVSLTYLIYAVLSADTIKARVVAECDSLANDFSVNDALRLPYLQAVIRETLRLYGAAPGALPRSVPSGGRTLGSYFLSSNVVVSTQAYSLHRNEDVFPQPLVFNPDRWMAPTQQMKDVYMPWGGGTRICLGMHLAEMELAYTAALFFRTFSAARLAAETTAESMEQENYFLIAPKSHRCVIEAK